MWRKEYTEYILGSTSAIVSVPVVAQAGHDVLILVQVGVHTSFNVNWHFKGTIFIVSKL